VTPWHPEKQKPAAALAGRVEDSTACDCRLVIHLHRPIHTHPLGPLIGLLGIPREDGNGEHWRKS
jgi:hypothetical protein